MPGRGRDYQSGVKTVSPTPYWTEARFFAAGGLCSTVRDLVRWEKALEEGRVVSPAMLRAMRTPARLPDGLEADYGYGTRLGVTGRHRKIGHTGGGQSNKAVLARYPDDDVTVAVLLNTERANAPVTATDLEERIERLFFGLAEPSPRSSPVPEQELHRPVGQLGVRRRGRQHVDDPLAEQRLVQALRMQRAISLGRDLAKDQGGGIPALFQILGGDLEGLSP